MRSAARGDPDYPARLLRLGAQAPVRVWWRGDLPDPARPALAVVGSRRIRPGGLAIVRRAVDAAVAAGLVVVSGLSPGVDQAAHERCLDRGGVGLAIVGGGADAAEDPVLAALATRLASAGGAVLSAWPPGTQVSVAARIARCALQVAWADEVLVAQYDGPGDGTVHAVRAARALRVPVLLPDPTIA